MRQKQISFPLTKWACGGLVVTIVVVIVGWLFLGLSPRCLFVPQSYEGDALWSLQMIKSLIRGDWNPFEIIKSTSLGFPFGLNLGDYPIPDVLHFVWLKGLSFFSSDPVVIYNLYFLLSYLLISWTFFFTGHELQVGIFSSGVFAILFSFLPFHMQRYSHLYLAAYYQVPLLVLVLIQIWDEEPPFVVTATTKRGWRLSLRRKKDWVALATILLSGLGGVYYASYFCLLAVPAALSAAWERRNIKGIVSSLLLIIGIGLSMESALLPYQLHEMRRGTNSSFDRLPIENEILGLKLTHLILPSIDHRLALFRSKKETYDKFTEVVEGREESLGIVGTLGLVILLIHLILRESSSLEGKFSVLAITAILFATVGGGASIAAFLGFSKLRSHNRISIFLGCMALMAVAQLVCRIQSRVKINPYVYGLLLCAVLLLGLWDQTTPGTKFRVSPPEGFIADLNFVEDIEKVNSPATAILQLPFIPFPESPPVNEMTDYTHFRPYLHSHFIKWSYGAMRGRMESAIIEEASKPPLSIEKIKALGYSGIYIDRFGYADYGRSVEDELTSRLGISPLVSSDGREAYYKIQ